MWVELPDNLVCGAGVAGVAVVHLNDDGDADHLQILAGQAVLQLQHRGSVGRPSIRPRVGHKHHRVRR